MRPMSWAVTLLCALACKNDINLGKLATTEAETSTGAPEPTTSSPDGECGDGVVDPGEDCDGGGKETPDCNADCTEVRCGDGIINEMAGEECEVLNDVEGDGCEDDCTKTPAPRVVFVTGKVYSSNLGGLAGADARCQQSAEAAGLPGTYMAWLSDNTGTPASRMIKSSVPYVLPDGTEVAKNWSALTAPPIMLLHAIDMTETGNKPQTWPLGLCADNVPCTQTWSNTSASGEQLNIVGSCNNWTTEDDQLTDSGNWTAIDGYWAGWVWGTCAHTLPLYCFQQ
jgi:cysteine-rich repeat protein